MLKCLNVKISRKGFTLIEVLVGTFLFLIVFLGIFLAYQLGLKVVSQSKNRITATAIVNGELEKIRNLAYESVGVEGGFPDGILQSSKTTFLNGVDYTIETRVDYVVDSADGISSPEDECPNDYKRVAVKVSWSEIFAGEVQLVTDVSPETLAQECAEIGGILSISVFDAYGIMVPWPLIEIRNPATDEVIKSASPVEGSHFFLLVPDNYKVVISKTNYSGSRTYGIEEVAIPEKPHILALEGGLTEISFSIDKLSSITVETRGTQGAGYPPIHNVTFNLTGAKTIGLDSDEEPVYKYSQNHTTSPPGQVDIPNLEWDSYTFSVSEAAGLDLVAIESPLGNEIEQPFGLPPDTHQNVRLVLSAENSLLATVQDIDTGEPIFSAEVILDSNTQYTDENGQTYFIPLEVSNYSIQVQASGYCSYSGSVFVEGDTSKIINLQRIE